MNPNPRKIPQCQPNDLVKLSTCCNDLLHKLDECKPDDLACECCALQSINQDCYGLCPGNPSTNFLTVLLSDCSHLNDVNACSLPFKKTEGVYISSKKVPFKTVDDVLQEDEKFDASLKSKVTNNVNQYKAQSDQKFIKKKIKLIIDKGIHNHTNHSNITLAQSVKSGATSSNIAYNTIAISILGIAIVFLLY
ncbi:hypothetical protein G210_2662 [Candida maltosa Xu316]|uniref:Uncharacterized protein n=1 Tax=Candida maltosa (strain Xu316) TaxID=1245528 RepID=M3IL15_CANMX|nr:hypothetical protein G210_2662 [Candida maltosa Xu316]